MITQGELRNLIEYDPQNGLWRWRDLYNKRERTWFKGSPQVNGYLTIRVDGKLYYAHQLAWLWFHGELLKHLDHKDRVKSNNSIENLRPANKSKNAVNAKVRSDNSSGFPGVSKVTGRNLWHAYVNKDGIRYQHHFKTEVEAVAWAREMRIQLFGEFVPTEVKSA